MPSMTIGDTQFIIDRAKKAGMIRNQLAYVLATTFWETANTMKPVKEAYWLSEDWRRQNLRYYPWYGRGYVQLTWEENYARADKELKLDGTLLAEPDRALDRDISTNVLLLGMSEGWFTGRKLSDYITLQKSDFVGARTIINGTDKNKEIADIAKDYDKSLTNAGYGVDDPAVDDTEARLSSLEEWRASVEKSS
jgi:putative chitinase